MSDHREPVFEDLERRARQAFDASVDSLDARTLSRLNQARRRALAASAPGPQRSGRWWAWAPAGALAASVLAAALLLRGPTEVGPGTDPAAANPAALTQEPLEMLAAGEEFEIATDDEDLEFYRWVEQATADVTNGKGRS